MMATGVRPSVDELVRLVGAMKTHGGRRSPAPHKPLLVLWAVWRRASDPDRPRLFAYMEPHAPMVDLLTAAGRGRRPRPAYPFIRLGSEPFWELSEALDLNDAGDVSSVEALVTSGVTGGFTATFDPYLTDHTVARHVAHAAAATWFPLTVAADLNALARELAERC